MPCSHRQLSFQGSNQYATRVTCLDCNQLRLLIHHSTPESVVSEALTRRQRALSTSTPTTHTAGSPANTSRSSSVPSANLFQSPASSPSSPPEARPRFVQLPGSPSSGRVLPPPITPAVRTPPAEASAQMENQRAHSVPPMPQATSTPAMCMFCGIKPSWNGKLKEYCSTACKAQASPSP